MLPLNLRWAAVLLLCSWLILRLGIFVGEQWVPPATGYPAVEQTDLFRFDADYYLDIAKNGYHHDGDPSHSPNIVFAPLYPLLIRAVATITTLDKITVGFALNKIFILLALWVWLNVLTPLYGLKASRWILLALVTSAGSYALHAYYSESTMWLALGLVLWGRDTSWIRALAAGALGASRLTALPLAAIIAFNFLRESIAKRSPQNIPYAIVAASGGAAYLIYLWSQFGEPLSLISEIQHASWALFHPPGASWLKIVDGEYLLHDLVAAVARGTFLDIRTLNLLWMILGLASAVYILKRRKDEFAVLFATYAVFIYVSSAPSEFLISTHRFMLLMVPIFLFFNDSYQKLRERSVAGANVLLGLLFTLNWTFALLHTAMFNQGVWFWF